MTFIKHEIRWLHEHARRNDDGSWWCKSTGKPIATADVGKSMHDGIFPLSGSGEVRVVTHLACTGCTPDKDAPSYGTPIREAELTEAI